VSNAIASKGVLTTTQEFLRSGAAGMPLLDLILQAALT
jgi:hypothetical protein